MSGPKRNPDKLNTIGIVVVGVCSAVLVYVAIVALQAFYVNDTSEIQTMADYGGQDTTAKGHKADELRNITEPASNSVAPGAAPTYRIPIDHAIDLVVEDAKKDPSHMVPALPPQTKPTIQPIFGRPKVLATPPPTGAPPAEAGSGAGSAASTGPGAAGSGSGSGSAVPSPAELMTPTGAAHEPQPVPGAGGHPNGAPAPHRRGGAAGAGSGAHAH